MSTGRTLRRDGKEVKGLRGKMAKGQRGNFNLPSSLLAFLPFCLSPFPLHEHANLKFYASLSRRNGIRFPLSSVIQNLLGHPYQRKE